jgi:hypothetical protein
MFKPFLPVAARGVAHGLERQCNVLFPKQRLNCLPDPQGHGSLRPPFFGRTAQGHHRV